jgi:Domain of unknown function (DUF4349)
VQKYKGVSLLKRSLSVIVMIACFLLISACSSNSKTDNAKMSADKSTEMNPASSNGQESQASLSNEAPKTEQSSPADIKVPNQMVIYQADLHLRVKKFEQTLQKIEEQVLKHEGYIAQSNVMKEGKEQVSGIITVRIPQTHFQAFLHDAEGQAAEVLQRNINGTDVTEEYVDLESRLKSKRVVEERLTSFIQSATKTEDLLKISDDLAAVQEEIEMIQGRMKYLENQTALSTITIRLYENKVIVPNLEEDDLNTWEKTKKQFMNSTNMLLAALSGLVVFVLGNLPIIVLLAIVAIVIFFYLRRFRNRNSSGD